MLLERLDRKVWNCIVWISFEKRSINFQEYVIFRFSFGEIPRRPSDSSFIPFPKQSPVGSVPTLYGIIAKYFKCYIFGKISKILLFRTFLSSHFRLPMPTRTSLSREENPGKKHVTVFHLEQRSKVSSTITVAIPDIITAISASCARNMHFRQAAPWHQKSAGYGWPYNGLYQSINFSIEESSTSSSCGPTVDGVRDICASKCSTLFSDNVRKLITTSEIVVQTTAKKPATQLHRVESLHWKSLKTYWPGFFVIMH